MRNRFRKSVEANFHSKSSSTASSSNDAAKGDSTTPSTASSTPNDASRPSLALAPQAVVNSRTMGAHSKTPRDSKSMAAAAFAPSPSSAASSSPASSPSAGINGFTPSSSNSKTAGPSNLSRTLSIRAVANRDDRPRPSYEDETSTDSSVTRNSASYFSSSVNSNMSAYSYASQTNGASTKSPNSRLKQEESAAASAAPPSFLDVRIPHTDTPQRSESRFTAFGDRPSVAATATNGNRAAGGNGSIQPNGAQEQHGDASATDGGAWDSTIGKAGLGKTGRVINRLVSENDALKRDLKIERLKAEEAKQAARLLEDKMERLVSDYESRLLEANVHKTLLARKERQVESLQGAMDSEKQRAADAVERERTWRTEMERAKTDGKRQTEEAVTKAALMEGRYNAISGHWRDQGESVKTAMKKMSAEISALSAARRADDDKISTLRDVCDQQDGNIRVIWQQKEEIAAQFAAYKKTQEDALEDIKTSAARREAEQEKMLAEARETLEKLKWALSVKKNVEWAE